MSKIVSEVAYFRQQQALMEEAAHRCLSGYAITASHESITARMQRGAERVLRLIEEGRHEEAQAILNTENWDAEEQPVAIVQPGSEITAKEAGKLPQSVDSKA